MQSAKACKSTDVEVLQFECCGLIHTLSKAGQWGTGPIGLRNRPGQVTGGTTRFQPNKSSRDKRWCWLLEQTRARYKCFNSMGSRMTWEKKIMKTLSQTPGCLVGVFIIVFKKSSLLHIWNQNWSGREVQNNHLEGWVVNNIHVLSWNLHINPSQI